MSDPSPSTDNPLRREPRENRGRWGKIIAWAAVSLAVLVLSILGAVAILLHSARFHAYLISTAEKKASSALGTPVELKNFTIHLSNLSLDLYGLTVHGAEPYANPPLLEVRHIALGVRVVSILHRQWYLDNVRVDDPVARVFSDSHGISNLPKLKSNGSGHTNLFELGIRHAVLDHGEVYYNNKKSALEADLHDVNFRSAFDTVQDKYSGSLRYRDGHLQYGSFRPIPHSLDVEFDATPNVFHLTQAKIISDSSQVELTATVNDYANPNIQAKYDATLNGSELRRILKNSSIPAGVVHTSGILKYQAAPAGSVMEAIAVEGNLNSTRLDVVASKIRLQVRDATAQYSLTNGDVAMRNFRARLLGGQLTGNLLIRDITGNSRSRLTASLRGISLAALRRLSPAARTRRNIALSGALNADASAAWGKTLDDLVAHTDATLRGRVSGANDAANVIPVNGAIHGSYSAANQQITLRDSYLRMPETALTLNGTVSRRSSLAVQFQSSDLRELDTIADLVRTPGRGEHSRPLGLAGTAEFQGVVRGSTADPHLSGVLSASNLQLKGTKWKVLRSNIELSPSEASLQHADLEVVSGGRVTFNAEAGLRKWSFTRTSPIQIELHASRVNIADLARIAGLQTPVAGTLAASVYAHGTEIAPIGHGQISLANAKLYEQPIPSASLTFTGTEDQVHGNLTAHIAAGTLVSTISIQPKEKSYTAELNVNGIHLDRLQALTARNVDLQGVVSAHGSGQGTLNNPQFHATLQIPQLKIQQAALNQQIIHGLTLQMAVANHIATASLNSQAINTSIRADAKVNLSGDYLAEATLDTQSIPLQPLLAIYAPSQASEIRGETEVHATLRGPLKNKKLLEVHVTVPTLKLEYGSKVQLAAASPIHVDYKDGVIALERAAIRGTDTNLQVQGSIPIDRHAPASLLLLGTVNLQLAQLFNPDISSSGELQFDINSYGVAADSNVEGQVKIVDANFSNGDLPIGLRHGNGVLSLTKDRLNIKNFQASVGGGTLTAQGGMAYRPSIQFDLGAAAKGVRMLYPQGVREEIDADLRLTGTRDNALLGGRVRVQDLSFTPDFDLTSFAGQLSGGISPPPSQGFAQNLRLNLAVSSTNNLNLVSRTLSVDGTANLQVRGTAAEPVILGRVNLNDGDIIFNGNRFTLNGGTIEFVNPAETQPVVNVALNTTIQQYNIHLRFNGPVDQLRTNYSSDPSLPAADIINLLAFGQTSEASAANPTPGDQAAMSAVASQVSSQITSRVSKIAGISQLSINPVLAGGSAQGPAGAIVTIQQRVTGNLFVTFSTNVTSTQNQIIMGQYRLSPSVALSATRDQNGGFAFDTTFKKSW